VERDVIPDQKSTITENGQFQRIPTLDTHMGVKAGNCNIPKLVDDSLYQFKKKL